MIYDFNQEMVINNNKADKKSQVEIIIGNIKSKKNENISEDMNYPYISIENFNKDSKNKKYKANDNNLKMKNIQKENTGSKKNI